MIVKGAGHPNHELVDPYEIIWVDKLTRSPRGQVFISRRGQVFSATGEAELAWAMAAIEDSTCAGYIDT